jgi:hypothetical protein
MPALVIRVECDDESDLDWLRPRIEGAVSDVVEEQREDGRLDGSVEVGFEIDFE